MNEPNETAPFIYEPPSPQVIENYIEQVYQKLIHKYGNSQFSYDFKDGLHEFIKIIAAMKATHLNQTKAYLTKDKTHGT